MHGIVKKTVADAAALAAETASSTEVADRSVWLQANTGQLWVPRSTSAGDFDMVETKAYGDSRLSIFGTWCSLSAPATTSVRFAPWQSISAAPNAGEVSSLVVVPVNMTVTALYFSVIITLTTDTVTWTLRKNGVDTALTGTIPANQQITSFTGLNLAVAAGDKLSLKLVQSSTQAQASWSLTVSVAYKTADTG